MNLENLNYDIKYEDFIKEILKKYSHYSKFSAFRQTNTSKPRRINAYYIAEHNGWLEQVKKDIEQNHFIQKEKEYEAFRDKVKDKYENYEDLTKDKKSKLYSQLCYNKWYKRIKKDLFPNTKERKEKGYWNNFEHCLKESEKYSSRREFASKSGVAYMYSRQNFYDEEKNIKWIDVMIPLPSLDNKIGNVYYYLFKDINVDGKKDAIYIGITIRPEKRDRTHRSDIQSSVYKFAKENNVDIPPMCFFKKNISVRESRRLEGEYVKKMMNENYLVLNKAKCGEECSAIGLYNTNKLSFSTYEELLNVIKNIKKYKTYEEFIGDKNNWTIEYRKAFNESWIRRICKDCGFKTGHCYYNNFEEFLEDVKNKHKTYRSFRYKGNNTRHNSNEWVTAMRHNDDNWLIRVTEILFPESIKDTNIFLQKREQTQAK